MAVRICLLGRFALEVDGSAGQETRLGGLGRTALAYLALERRRPVPRDELADVLWGEDLPSTWQSALRGVLSRVRSTLADVGEPAVDVVRNEFGCYQMVLSPAVTVDVEEVAAGLASAEQQLGPAPEEAQRVATEAAERASRQFLPGATGAWVERRQAELAALHVRALELVADAASTSGDYAAAIAAAEEAVDLAPLHESTHQRLMGAHARAGDRGAALKAYQRCRELLAQELGVNPSPETEEMYIGLLSDEPAPARPPESPGAVRPTNLPASRTTFVGRRDQIHELRQLLGGARLVTLTGPGGVGKSRLAIRVAEELVGAYPDGVWLAELAGLADPSLVVPELLSVFGVPEMAGRPIDALANHLGDRAVLLVLDNCEHVVSACASLCDALLQACDTLQILATSREPVGVPGETTWTVPSLSVPESAQLFGERALAAVPDLDIDASATDVERICAQLDGIPLAIELAAARTRVLSIAEIASRLDDRLRLLVGGPRAAPSRHRTLRATIDWSVGALPDPERSLFARLSVFAGGFTLEAAEAVGRIRERGGDGDVLDALGALVDKSLVTVDRSGGRVRYRMLESLRQYAAEQLDAGGETTAARDRHLDWAVVLATSAEPDLESGEQQQCLAVLDAEHDNLRVALDWAAARHRVDDGLRLAASLVRFWEIRGYFREGRARLEAFSAQPEGAPALRAKALNATAVLAQHQGDFAASRALYQESLVIWRAVGDRRGAATALHGLANLAVAGSDLVTARSLFEENLAIAGNSGSNACWRHPS